MNFASRRQLYAYRQQIHKETKHIKSLKMQERGIDITPNKEITQEDVISGHIPLKILSILLVSNTLTLHLPTQPTPKTEKERKETEREREKKTESCPSLSEK